MIADLEKNHHYLQRKRIEDETHILRKIYKTIWLVFKSYLGIHIYGGIEKVSKVKETVGVKDGEKKRREE